MKEPEKAIPINNSSMRDLTGGGELSARTLYSTKTSVYLHNTQILEANAKPNLKHDPEKADEERLIDLNFPSTFTSADEVDEENNMYEAKTEYKTIEWQDKHAGGLIGILMERLEYFKKAGYKLDTFIPESVKARTAEYMMKSFDIFNSFKLIYQLAGEDEDVEELTLAKATTTIRHHETFKLLPKAKQREYSAQYIKEFVLKNKFFKKYIKEDYHTKQIYLTGWKLIKEEDE
jgi:phage/plasmid-associated DNA primase